MSDPRVPLKNSLFAAVLALLIPGLGHLYQGRLFKAIIYSVCILGAFFYGMHLADWKAVNCSADPSKRNLGYYAQVATGLPAAYAMVQSSRYRDPANKVERTITAPMTAPFEGALFEGNSPEPSLDLKGEIHLEPPSKPGDSITGTFRGTDDNGNAVEYQLGGQFELGPKIGGEQGRFLGTGLVDTVEGRQQSSSKRIVGFIPRPFLDWFEAPLNDEELQSLNRRLGKRYELALVYTWIAGLLNVLAIWDALEGPAYGYGDEEDDSDEEEKKRKQRLPEERTEPSLAASAKS